MNKKEYTKEARKFLDGIKELLERNFVISPQTIKTTVNHLDKLVCDREADESPALDLPEPGTYRHYKGGLYHLAWLAMREHDGRWMCCYARQGSLERYVRPASEWFDVVDETGTTRYTKIG